PGVPSSIWFGQVLFADVTSRSSHRAQPAGRPSQLRVSPRVLTLALSVMGRHVTEDPVRALLLGWRVLPGRVRPWLRWAGVYGRATVAWGSGDRKEALALLDTTPKRLARVPRAVDRPAVARRALDRMPTADPARALLRARLAAREGRLKAAVAVLDGVPGRKQAKVRAAVAGDLDLLA